MYEQHNGEWFAVVYTDGSLYDAQSDAFCRAGWGAYYGEAHPANAKGPLLSRKPTTFRAELRAVYHVFQHVAVDSLVRCDCKGVVTLVDNILNGDGYDAKHNDADLLEAIQTTVSNVHKLDASPFR